MDTLGGTVYVRNAIIYDYCIEAAIESLLDICDEVVCVEASSQDDTRQLIRKYTCDPKFKLISDVKWDETKFYENLEYCSNLARLALKSKWHLCLEADEVFHEKDKDFIRNVVKNPNADTFLFDRINFWSSPKSYVHPSHPKAPCGSSVVRLGLAHYPVDEQADTAIRSTLDPYDIGVSIYHYGFIRDKRKMADKVIACTKAAVGTPDNRVVKQKQENGEFDPTQFFGKDELHPFGGSHPKYIKRWLKERYPDALD